MPINDINFLKKYNYNNYFVELGSFVGGTIQLALEAEFKFIKSVELNYYNYELCKIIFRENENVQLYYGASEDLLWDMIEDINEPITFLVDSHYSGVSDTYVTSKGKTYSSIRSDLETIAKHPIKTHTLLIDDRRDFNSINMDYITEEEVIRLIKCINPDYKISFDTGDYTNILFENDILVARV